jgi:hypothetical protein
MNDRRWQEIVDEILQKINPLTASTAAATTAGAFGIADLQRSQDVVEQMEDEHARRFNEQFVKPKGFDLERGDLMFVGRMFDTKLIPSKWQGQTIRHQFIAPFDLVLMQGSERTRDLGERMAFPLSPSI